MNAMQSWLATRSTASCGPPREGVEVRELESELAAVLQNGHSSECQEVMPNYGSVACPIRGKNDISHSFVRQFSGWVSRGA